MNSDKFGLRSGGLKIVRKTINDEEQCIVCDEGRRNSQRLLRGEVFLSFL